MLHTKCWMTGRHKRLTSWRLYSPQQGTEAKCEMYDVGARRLCLRQKHARQNVRS